MKVTKDDIQGVIIKHDETYIVEDNNHLDNLVLSKTILHPFKETSGHKHDDLDEVYVFESGNGTMQMGDDLYEVSGGDVVLVPGGKFHKVFNTTSEELVFICVFQHYNR